MTTDRNRSGRLARVRSAGEGQEEGGSRFDHEVYGGRGVYLRIDQSVKQGRVDEAGEMLLPGGQHLFEMGPGTMWGGDVPDVRAPE